MHRIIKSLFVYFCLLVISGCAVKEFKSSGRLASPSDKIKNLNLIFNPTPPREVNIFIIGDRENPPIVNQLSDGTDAAREGKKAIQILKDNLSAEFEKQSKERGLYITPKIDAPSLKINVIRYHHFRSKMGTSTGLELGGNLTLPNSPSTIWSFSSIVSPKSVYHKFDLSLVSSFAQRLVDEMYADDVINK